MSKRVLLWPSPWNYYLNNQLFERGTCYQGLYQRAFFQWRESAGKAGYLIDTCDIYPISTADLLWFMDMPREKDVVQKAKSLAPKAKTVLQILESPALGPHFYEEQNYSVFDYVISYNRNQCDEKIIYHYLLPNTVTYPDKILPYSKRKVCCMINTNRVEGWFAVRQKGLGGLPGIGPFAGGWHLPARYIINPSKGELYGWRRKLARTAEQMGREYLDVYGPGWNGEQISWFPLFPNRPYANRAGGAVAGRKSDIVKQYRFCISVENYAGNRDYIGEKMFDALMAGSVPVYLGDERIAEYVPERCFVDVRKYKTIADLLHYLKHCPEAEWDKMITAGQEYIRSDQIRVFTDEAFAERMTEVLRKIAP